MKWMKKLGLVVLLILLFGMRCTTIPGEGPLLEKIPFPEDNPPTAEKIAFGRMLFFDKRLSANNEISCATCHQPQKAFTDGLQKSVGVEGRVAMRNAPSLLNSAFFKSYMYDGEIKTLELQVPVPIQDHQEMGSSFKEVLEKLSKDAVYQRLSEQIFKRKLDAYVITRALSTFERSLLSRNSRFDKYWAGARQALNADEIAGWKLFSEKLYCTKCHPAPDFTNYKVLSNGLYSDYGFDQGRYRINGLEQEKGTFKVPSLRNVSLTAPYMHDGSMRTLREVILHYSSGGKNFPNKSKIIQPFKLTDHEINQLELFLSSLTDTSSCK